MLFFNKNKKLLSDAQFEIENLQFEMTKCAETKDQLVEQINELTESHTKLSAKNTDLSKTNADLERRFEPQLQAEKSLKELTISKDALNAELTVLNQKYKEALGIHSKLEEEI